MDPLDLIKIACLMGIFVLVPLIWVILRGQRSGDPEDAHWDYRIMEDARNVHPRAVRGPFEEWYKITNERDLRWLLTSSPIRLTITYCLFEGPATYKVLYEKVRKKIEENFSLKVTEMSYIWHFDWLVDAMIIQRMDDVYRLAPLPPDVIDLVYNRFRTKMKT